jgi:hypothetical protein
MAQQDRSRNIRDMPYHHRHEGYTIRDRIMERLTWRSILDILNLLVTLPFAVQQLHLPHVHALVAQVTATRQLLWDAVDPVDPRNSNRDVDSFTPSECWHNFRIRKHDIRPFMTMLNFPNVLTLSNDLEVWGEYAFLLMLYRDHYPQTLAMQQTMFGREISQISRIHNGALQWMYDHHQAKVVGNIWWYANRFNIYNVAIREKIISVQGAVPNQVENIFAFLDGTHRTICRPFEHNNAQNAFYNGYFGVHVLMYLIFSFPDGMLVVDIPRPGHFTDIMLWRDSDFRAELEAIMLHRIQLGELYKTFVRNIPRHNMFSSFSYLSISSDRFVLVSIPLFLYHTQGCRD